MSKFVFTMQFNKLSQMYKLKNPTSQVIVSINSQTYLAICAQSCLSCSNLNPSICIQCLSGFYLNNGICYACNSTCKACSSSNPNTCL